MQVFKKNLFQKKSLFHILRCKNAFATKIQHMQVYVEEENSNKKLLSFKG